MYTLVLSFVLPDITARDATRMMSYLLMLINFWVTVLIPYFCVFSNGLCVVFLFSDGILYLNSFY